MPAIWKLDDEFFRGEEGRAALAAGGIQLHEWIRRPGGVGVDLGRWILAPTVVEELARFEEQELGRAEEAAYWREKPAMPREAGACVILFVQAHPPPDAPARPAFPLPWCWKADLPIDPLLPPGLVELANSVRSVVPGGERFGLQCGTSNVDFRGWTQADFSSGWAPLAIALSAVGAGRPANPRVWSTGAWSNRGVEPVNGVAEKARVCVEWGVEALFVPESNRIEAQEAVPPALDGARIEIGSLREDVPDVRAACATALARSRLPPHPDEADALRDCRPHYEWLLAVAPEEADRYYRSSLLPTIVEALRRQVESSIRFDEPPTHLVSLPANGITTQMLVKTLQPTDVLLLRMVWGEAAPDPDEDARLRDDLLGCQLRRPRVEAATISYPNRVAVQIRSAMHNFAPDLPADRWIFDLTSGYKLASLLFLTEIAPEGSWLTYLVNDNRRGRVLAFSERLVVWRKGTPFPEECPEIDYRALGRPQ
jgi:hypothetical protein